MNDPQFSEVLKQFKDQVPILWLFKIYGQDPYTCLDCGSEAHYWEDANLVKCWKCGYKIDSIDMVKKFDKQESRGWYTTIKDSLKFLLENHDIFGNYEIQDIKERYSSFELKINPIAPGMEKDLADSAAHYLNGKSTYYEDRGISSLLIKKFGLGENDEGYTIPVLLKGIPMNTITRLKKTYGKFKVKNMKDHTIIPWNMDSIKDASTIYIVEGWADALSILTIYESNPLITAVALNSTSNVKRFIATLIHMNQTLVGKEIILGFDSDAAGVKATDLMSILVKQRYDIEAKTIELGEYNDINDLLVADKEELVKVLGNSVNKYKETVSRKREKLGF